MAALPALAQHPYPRPTDIPQNRPHNELCGVSERPKKVRIICRQTSKCLLLILCRFSFHSFVKLPPEGTSFPFKLTGTNRKTHLIILLVRRITSRVDHKVRCEWLPQLSHQQCSKGEVRIRGEDQSAHYRRGSRAGPSLACMGPSRLVHRLHRWRPLSPSQPPQTRRDS